MNTTAPRKPPISNGALVLYGTVAGALTGLVLFAVLVLWWKSYGYVLFAGTPFAMGTISASVVNLEREVKFRWSLLTVLTSQLLLAALLLGFAWEGLLCLVMATPIALILGLLGAWLGFVWAERHRLARLAASTLALIVPLLLGGAQVDQTWPVREVVTEIRIDASPAEVWPFVLEFGELEPVEDWIFRLGISHPLRARIEGEGVGAVRYCEFSTGPFVEPITVWQPPRLLAFDVAAQPEPMHEWSPYARVAAPHLRDGLHSRRGQFELELLADGATMLRGTTWYEVRMGPQIYWSLWSDMIIHRIHRRVLRQIRSQAETTS